MADTKLCPFCAETIKKAAIVCKHCGRELPGYREAAPLGVPERKRADAVGVAINRGGKAVSKKSNVKWWLSSFVLIGVISQASNLSSAELGGRLGSVLFFFLIGWAIDSFRESRWNKNSKEITRGSQAPENAHSKRPLTLIVLAILVGIAVIIYVVFIVSNLGGGASQNTTSTATIRSTPLLHEEAIATDFNRYASPYERQEATKESVNSTVAAVLPYLPTDRDCVLLDDTFVGPFYSDQKYCLIGVVDYRSPYLTSRSGPPIYWTNEGNNAVTFWLVGELRLLRIVDSISAHADIRVGQCIIAIGYAKHLPIIQLSPAPTDASFSTIFSADTEKFTAELILIDATGQISLCPNP